MVLTEFAPNILSLSRQRTSLHLKTEATRLFVRQFQANQKIKAYIEWESIGYRCMRKGGMRKVLQSCDVIMLHVFAEHTPTCYIYTKFYPFYDHAPVPLTLFRSNSKFDQNFWCSGAKCTQLITIEFSTHHDILTVVACAKFCCDQLSTPNLIEFRIRSK